MGIAYFSLKRSKMNRRGFSLIELLIVIAIILIIAAIAIPRMNKQLMATREMAAIREITAINQAQIQYNSQFGKYASTLVELGPPASGADGLAAANLIPKSLADGKASGYNFTVQASPTGYVVIAVPEQFGSSGSRSFYSDQNGGTRVSTTADPATDKSPELK